MKRTKSIFCIIVTFLHIQGMEKSPRQSEELVSYTAPEMELVQSLLDRIESETSYVNPHASARIRQASQQLMDIPNKSLIRVAWAGSSARANAATLLQRSMEVMIKNENSILAGSCQMIFAQAQSIFSAIQLLHEKIETMHTLTS